MISHIGTENGPNSREEAAVRNIGQCTKSVIQQYCVRDDGYGCKPLTVRKIMTVLTKEAPTNFVPAVAVKRKGLVLLVVIGRKGRVDGFLC